MSKLVKNIEFEDYVDYIMKSVSPNSELLTRLSDGNNFHKNENRIVWWGIMQNLTNENSTLREKIMRKLNKNKLNWQTPHFINNTNSRMKQYSFWNQQQICSIADWKWRGDFLTANEENFLMILLNVQINKC